MPLTIENGFTNLITSVTGTVQYFELLGTNSNFPTPVFTGPNPASIQTDQPWQVRFNFTAIGQFFGIFGNAVRWDCDVLMEQYGPGENPASLPSISIPGVLSFNNSYNGIINIPASAVPDGVYRIVARLSLRPISGTGPILVAGFEELGLVQFYTG